MAQMALSGCVVLLASIASNSQRAAKLFGVIGIAVGVLIVLAAIGVIASFGEGEGRRVPPAVGCVVVFLLMFAVFALCQVLT